MKKFFTLTFLIVLIGFPLTFCDSGTGSGSGTGNKNDSNSGAYDLEEPDVVVIPGKTAAEYFAEEGIRLGWNLGNTLDAIDWDNPSSSSESSWGNPTVTQALFDGLKTQGIDIVRIPVTWTGFTGSAPDYTITASRLQRVAAVVNMANTAGLKVIINIHHDGVSNGGKEFGWLKTGFNASDPTRGSNAIGTINNTYKTEMYNRFEKVWTQIANHFKDYDQWLIFQSMNEVHNGDWDNFPSAQFTIMNELNQIFSNTVRATGGKNETRYLMYPGLAAKPSAVTSNNFKLPVDSTGPGRQIVTFHYYDPFPFAHDAAANSSWTGTAGERSAIDNLFKQFYDKYTGKGIPVIIGEMGPRVAGNDSNSTRRDYRLTYISYVYAKAYELGLVPVYWDDGGSFYMMGRGGSKGTAGVPRDQHAADSLAAMRTAVGK